jgi:hypothetical protein
MKFIYAGIKFLSKICMLVIDEYNTLQQIFQKTAGKNKIIYSALSWSPKWQYSTWKNILPQLQ